MIEKISIHKVGNKLLDNTLLLSELPVILEREVKDLLEIYFTKHFKYEEIFRLFHLSDLNMNEVYSYATSIFENPENFHEQTRHLAKFLFDQSEHPKIKSGEFYVVYFKDMEYRNEIMDAVGLFKTENKDTFLRVFPKNESFSVEQDKGINVNKLDKACLIFNTEKEKGYQCVVLDNTNKAGEAHFWIDDFLQLQQVDNAYFKTEQTMTMYRNFVDEVLPEEFEINKIDQADLRLRSMDFFKENEKFDQAVFSSSVLKDPQLIDSFESYKMEYESDRDLELEEEFKINPQAVKKQNKFFKSVIKLDKNFHVYVHGDRSKIQRLEDSKGKFYKLYFETEN